MMHFFDSHDRYIVKGGTIREEKVSCSTSKESSVFPLRAAAGLDQLMPRNGEVVPYDDEWPPITEPFRCLEQTSVSVAPSILDYLKEYYRQADCPEVDENFCAGQDPGYYEKPCKFRHTYLT